MTMPPDIQAQFIRAQNALAAIANSPYAIEAEHALDSLGAELVFRMRSVKAEADLVRASIPSAPPHKRSLRYAP